MPCYYNASLCFVKTLYIYTRSHVGTICTWASAITTLGRA